MNNSLALPLNGPNGEAWITWGILAALFFFLVLASVIALWRASRAHIGGKLVFVQTQYPVNPVQVRRSGINDGTIDEGQGTVPPLTVRNKKASDSLLGHQITGFPEGEEQPIKSSSILASIVKQGRRGYVLGGCFVSLDSYETVSDMPVTQQKDTQRNEDV